MDENNLFYFYFLNSSFWWRSFNSSGGFNFSEGGFPACGMDGAGRLNGFFDGICWADLVDEAGLMYIDGNKYQYRLYANTLLSLLHYSFCDPDMSQFILDHIDFSFLNPRMISDTYESSMSFVRDSQV